MPHRVNLHCLTCPEPPDYDEEADGPLPKYRIKCGAPSVTISCVSSETTPQLCGHSEYTDASEPPKKYRIESVSASGTITQGSGGEITRKTSVTGSWTFDEEDCTYDQSYTYQYTITGEGYACSSSEVKSSFTGYASRVLGGADWGCDGPLYETPVDNSISRLVYQTDYDGLNSSIDGSATLTLSDEDTEEDAIARASATAGTDCTSLYELRTTTFSFSHRTVEYTATASGLVKGVSYKGCIRLQKREAYSGTEPEDADTETWIDVEPDEITAFVASEDEEAIATDVELPIAQGWEYRIAGAYIYPVSSPCECPTSYAPEE